MIEDIHTPETIPVEKANTSKDSEALISFIWRMSGRHQVILCLTAVLTTVLALIPIELQRRIIDTAIESKDYDTLFTLGAIYASILFIHQIVKFVFRTYQAWVAESTIKNTRKRLFEVRGAKEEDADENQGSSVSVITNEVEGIGTFVGEHISDASANAVMLLGAAGYMLYVEPQLAIYALVFFIPQIILVPFMQRFLNKLTSKRVDLMRKLSSEAASHTQASEAAPGIIKAVYKNRFKYSLVKYATKSMINMLNALAPLTVLLFGGYLVIQGDTTAGVIVAFLSGFQRMAGPMRGLISFYRLAEQTNVQHSKVDHWINNGGKAP